MFEESALFILLKNFQLGNFSILQLLICKVNRILQVSPNDYSYSPRDEMISIAYRRIVVVNYAYKELKHCFNLDEKRIMNLVCEIDLSIYLSIQLTTCKLYRINLYMQYTCTWMCVHIYTQHMFMCLLVSMHAFLFKVGKFENGSFYPRGDTIAKSRIFFPFAPPAEHIQ